MIKKIALYFVLPYQEKGFLKATLDFALRAVTLVVWGWVTSVLIRFVLDAWLYNYSPVQKMWWSAYGFVIFFATSWLAYILLFVRSYYYKTDEE